MSRGIPTYDRDFSSKRDLMPSARAGTGVPGIARNGGPAWTGRVARHGPESAHEDLHVDWSQISDSGHFVSRNCARPLT
jgi:hypothetical protein